MKQRKKTSTKLIKCSPRNILILRCYWKVCFFLIWIHSTQGWTAIIMHGMIAERIKTKMHIFEKANKTEPKNEKSLLTFSHLYHKSKENTLNGNFHCLALTGKKLLWSWKFRVVIDIRNLTTSRKGDKCHAT